MDAHRPNTFRQDFHFPILVAHFARVVSRFVSSFSLSLELSSFRRVQLIRSKFYFFFLERWGRGLGLGRGDVVKPWR